MAEKTEEKVKRIFFILLLFCASCSSFQSKVMDFEKKEVIGIPFYSSYSDIEKLGANPLQISSFYFGEYSESLFLWRGKNNVSGIDVDQVSFKISSERGMYSMTFTVKESNIKNIIDIIEKDIGQKLDNRTDEICIDHIGESICINPSPYEKNFYIKINRGLIVYISGGVDKTWNVVMADIDGLFKGNEKKDALFEYASEFSIMREKLMSFKDSADFAQVGFSHSGPYAAWLNKVTRESNKRFLVGVDGNPLRP